MDAYLRGLYQFNRGALGQALDFAREAARIDPKLAAAHRLTGMALQQQADFHIKTYSEILPEARAALGRSLDLDPDSGLAWSWLGETFFFGEHDWPRGEANLRRGFELDPGTGANYGFLLAAQGKYVEAIGAVDRALGADPANPSLITDAARIYHFARRYGDAVRLYRNAQQLSPGGGYAHVFLPVSLMLAGRRDEAFEAWLWTPNGAGPFGLANEFRQAYRTGAWPAVWQTYLDRVPPKAFWPVNKRWAVILLNRNPEALDMLEELERRGDSWMVQLEDPVYDHLRSEPRFKTLLKRFGYPEPMWR